MDEKLKYCPLLVHSETRLSLTVDGESYTNTWFSECLGNKCAAYQGGVCAKYCNGVRVLKKVED